MIERNFELDLAPNGRSSSIKLDGEDISRMLRAVSVSSTVEGYTRLSLESGASHVKALLEKLPEAQVTLTTDGLSVYQALQHWLRHSEYCNHEILAEDCKCSCGLEDMKSRIRGW